MKITRPKSRVVLWLLSAFLCVSGMAQQTEKSHPAQDIKQAKAPAPIVPTASRAV